MMAYVLAIRALINAWFKAILFLWSTVCLLYNGKGL